MSDRLRMRVAAAVLILAASVGLGGRMALAEQDVEQDAERDTAVISSEQDETSAAADAEAMAAASGVSDAAGQGETASAEEATQKREKKGVRAEAGIHSSNPDDANKHGAWRKREADKAMGSLQEIRRSMMLQGQ